MDNDLAGPMSSDRPARAIDSLTSLRGLFALWIVGYHFTNDLTRLFPSLSFAEIFLRSGVMAVPGFFVLSGFVLTHNYAAAFARPRLKRVIAFLGRRLARIYPVHFVTLVTVLAMFLVGRHFGYRLAEEGYTMRDFILNVVLAQYWIPSFRLNWNYPSWSISAEWFAYLLFPLFAWALVARLTTVARGVLAVVVTTFAGIVIYCGAVTVIPLLTVVPTFLAGASWAVVHARLPRSAGRAFHWHPELFAAITIASCCLPSPWATGMLVLATCALVGSLALAEGYAHHFWTLRPLLLVGEVSFSLYMTHTLAQKLLNRLLPTERFQFAGVLTRVAVLLSYAGVVSMWCLATYYIVERPFRSWGRTRLSIAQPARSDGANVSAPASCSALSD